MFPAADFFRNTGKIYPVELYDLVTEMFKYTSDDTIFSGMNLYPHFSTIRRGITDLVRFDKSVFQLDSIRYSLKIFFRFNTRPEKSIYLFVICISDGSIS